jgi:hypothetical protein
MRSLRIAQRPERGLEETRFRACRWHRVRDVVPKSVRFHRWGLGCRQSSFRHIAQALRDEALPVFGQLPLSIHALVPSSFRTQVRWSPRSRAPGTSATSGGDSLDALHGAHFHRTRLNTCWTLRLRSLFPAIPPGHSPGCACGDLSDWESQPAVGLPPVRGFPTLGVRGPLPRRITPASGGGTRERLSHAPPLADLPPAHGTFSGHAAHLRERPMTLSPQDSWGACTPA